MIQEQLPILILAIPLLGSFIVNLATGKSKTASYLLVIICLVFSFLAALGTLAQVLKTGTPIHYHLGDWKPPFGIELVVDHLSGMVLALVSGSALLTAIYSLRTVQEEIPDRIHHYYTLYLLLVSGLLGMVATGDAFNLYVLLEISALSSYALLARGRGLAYYSTFKYIIMGTIGACFYLLGVGYLYIKTGSLNMADLSVMLKSESLVESASIRIGFILIIIGMWIKMGFFPLHGWLPNAYTYASTTTSCLIAPLMTKVSVYVMIRLMFSVFSADYIFKVLDYDQLVVWLACVAILAGSLSALAQKDLKRILCYIVVAEIGYMVGGVWLADGDGFSGAVYHILADSMMTLCLFMAVGAVIYTTGKRKLSSMDNIFRKMPVTSVVFLIGAFSIIGIPPTCGFFSKWYLILGAVNQGQYLFVAALLISSLISALIFFKIIEIGYFPRNFGQDHDHGEEVAVKEAPLTMLVPMVATAITLLLIGLYTKEIIQKLVQFTVPPGL